MCITNFATSTFAWKYQWYIFLVLDEWSSFSSYLGKSAALVSRYTTHTSSSSSPVQCVHLRPTRNINSFLEEYNSYGSNGIFYYDFDLRNEFKSQIFSMTSKQNCIVIFAIKYCIIIIFVLLICNWKASKYIMNNNGSCLNCKLGSIEIRLGECKIPIVHQPQTMIHFPPLSLIFISPQSCCCQLMINYKHRI